MSDAQIIDESVTESEMKSVFPWISPSRLGRIPAQFLQLFEATFAKPKISSLKTLKHVKVNWYGIVRRYERDRDNVILELGRAETLLRKDIKFVKDLSSVNPSKRIFGYQPLLSWTKH